MSVKITINNNVLKYPINEFKMISAIFSNVQTTFNWFYATVPGFPVKGDQVHILHQPDEFYNQLVKSCSRATHRILLASLYIGTGEKEKALVNRIKIRSAECGDSLKIKILLDNLRGSRGRRNSSRHVLLPLLQQNPQCQVALYQTPKLNKFLQKVMPERYNELIGLQHMKIYVVDDDVIISGANLSHDYFTNRQDRYVIVKNCKQLADFFDGLVSIVCNLSLQLDKDNSAFYVHQNCTRINTDQFRNRITTYYNSFVKQAKKSKEYDTWIFPTIEIPPCDVHIDSTVVKTLLESIYKGTEVYLTSGYFNLTDELIKTILSSESAYRILVAHPTANGFYKSHGISRYIPDMYTALTKHFFQEIEKSSASDRIQIWEYTRENWTYHGKGIWITFPGETLPHLTVVGSSNFGSRSRDRDLESQLVILTENQNLRKQLLEEQKQMYQYGTLFSRDVFRDAERRIGFWINSFVWLLRSFF